ncbi:MAG: AmmeMemoRadiSam system radical SAM enzyme [Firmicutes bacterium]|nr:AmmeMemoRadiSam system radical SAM enzyme [Bacillota bacterium]
MGGIKCAVCPHGCVLEKGQTGLCRARVNEGGVVKPKNYGYITAMGLDPIEKKPLYRFHPKSLILSVGSFGCNLRCPFCQNHDIACADKPSGGVMFMPPEALLTQALECTRSIGVAFTYNEPLVGYEYVRDCAKLLKRNGLIVVLVTNGFVNEGPLLELLPYVDAMNIDLKGFTESFYGFVGGSLSPVLRTIELCAKKCHVEVTTLIVPDKNDGADEMRGLSSWLAKTDKSIPLHISRFFPRHKMADIKATPVDTVYKLAAIAREKLSFVYEGNC